MLVSVKVAAVEESDISKKTNSKFLCRVLSCSLHGEGLGVGKGGEGVLLAFTWWLLNEYILKSFPNCLALFILVRLKSEDTVLFSGQPGPLFENHGFLMRKNDLSSTRLPPGYILTLKMANNDQAWLLKKAKSTDTE